MFNIYMSDLWNKTCIFDPPTLFQKGKQVVLAGCMQNLGWFVCICLDKSNKVTLKENHGSQLVMFVADQVSFEFSRAVLFVLRTVCIY